jgi:hypothetical protein
LDEWTSRLWFGLTLKGWVTMVQPLDEKENAASPPRPLPECPVPLLVA